jgi:hypothetical protein
LLQVAATFFIAGCQFGIVIRQLAYYWPKFGEAFTVINQSGFDYLYAKI